jgi:protease YdgD
MVPGVGPGDPRTQADPGTAPWSAVARLNVAAVSRCTAVAIQPHWAATAAHCLWNRRLGRAAPLDSLHLLFGYDSGRFAQHVRPDRVVMVPGHDAALLHLPDPAPFALPPLDAAVPPGAALLLAGYGRDRAERLVVDSACHALPSPDPAQLRHDCAGTSGSSGGPLVVPTASGWRLAGLQVAARVDGAGGIAVPGTVLLRAIP